MSEKKPEEPTDRPPDETLTRHERETITTPGARVGRSSGRERLEAGQLFGPYRLIRVLGKGGFGQVWEAETQETGRRLALKVLTEAPVASGEALQRFHREGRLAASLSHPNCVYVFGAEEIEGTPVIAMELMPGGTLQDRLDREGPLPSKKAVDWILDIIEGLEAAQRKGVVHRDIKPSNCFLDETGRAKIGDFGLSRTLEVDAKLTVTGTFMGTPAYSSPEQVRGRDVDDRSDLYSVGATLYALLTGRPPFGGGQPGEVLARILSEPPVPFSEHRVVVPRGLERVVLRLMAKDREKRYPSHAALRAALLPFSSQGLTEASLAKRFAAFFVDNALLSPARFLMVFLTERRGIVFPFGLFLLQFLYFFILEGAWHRSLGKRLFGLRVIAASGGESTWPQALLRTLVFVPATVSPALLALFVSPDVFLLFASRGTPLVLLLGGYLVIACTMRASNGFAGVHERVSLTRVTATPERSPLVVPVRETVRPRPSGETGHVYGPYRVTEVLWERGEEALLAAEDPVLGRTVWIHRAEAGTHLRPLAVMPASRSGRLRWLQGAREEGGEWDAFEAPTGVSFFEWVRGAGRLGWGEVREILVAVAVEMEERRKEGRLDESISLLHTWVDEGGRARLLDFPALIPGDATPEAMDLTRWRAFLHQLALFGLTGRLVAEGDLEGQTPRVPLPEHSRDIVRALCGEGKPLDTLEELLAELHRFSGRPATVNHARRAAGLAMSGFVPFLGGMAGFVLWLVLGPVLEIVWLPSLLEEWRKMDAKQPGAQDPARSEALGRMIAHAAALMTVEAGPGGVPPSSSLTEAGRRVWALHVLSHHLSADERRLLYDIAARYLQPDARELAEARKLLHRPAVGPADCIGALLSFVGPAAALLGLLWAALLRGGASLRLAGIAVQTTNGDRASRWRCLLRALIAWSPLLVLGPLALWLDHPWDFWLMDAGILGAVAGTAYALLRPETGIQDRICGTRLVPR